MEVTFRQAIAFVQALGTYSSCAKSDTRDTPAGYGALYIHLRALLGADFWFDARTYSPTLWGNWIDGTQDNARNLSAYLRAVSDRLEERIKECDEYVKKEKENKSKC
jgi:hypothetical protein